MPNHRRAYIFVGMVIIFWSTVPTAFKLSLRHLSVVQLLLISSVTSTVALFFMAFVPHGLGFVRSFKWEDIRKSAYLGLLNPFFYYLVVLKSYTILPAQQAQPLNMTWGIVLVIMSIPVLKQKLHRIDLAAITISFIGVVLISIEGDFGNFQIRHPVGIVLALGSSFIWAFYWIMNLKDKLDPLLRLFLNFFFASIYAAVLFLIIQRGGHVSIPGILGAGYVGLFEMGITYALWLYALKYSKKTVNVTILIYFIPFISFIFVHFLVGETILVSSIIGAFFIVAGILLNKIREMKCG